MPGLGDVRPSQLMFSFGIGAILDLPEFSTLVLGIDYWNKDMCKPIAEPRLLAAVQRHVGQQVQELRLPPVQEGDTEIPGQCVPVVPFPRWMRCTVCGTIAPLEGGIFEKKESPYQATRFVHTHCPRKNPKFKEAPRAVPVRFLLACPDGHLSDVPWSAFVHDGQPCKEPHLYMNEFGVTGDASDIVIRCECGKKKQLSELVSKLRGDPPLFACNGLYPHLRQREQRFCPERVSLVSLGASNLWFSQTLSVLSLPDQESELAEIIRRHWDELEDADSVDTIKYLAHPRRLAALCPFAPEDVLRTLQELRQQLSSPLDEAQNDIKLPEWEVFTGKRSVQTSPKLEMTVVAPPAGYEATFEKTMLLSRLSEVRAMYGFTRLNTQQELDLGIVTPQKTAPLTKESPTWLPAYESHGEGLFLRLKEAPLQAWEARANVQKHDRAFILAHQAWRKSRKFQDVQGGYPGIRFVLLHSFAHALMQQIVLDCGYTAASIRERLYCRTSGMDGGPMAGVLIYTAAADSEGTLGGLVSLGMPNVLGRYVRQALENMKLCTSDPLCAEKIPEANGRSIHGASCHACLFSPETSCECGNRYLDRNVLVETFAAAQRELAFWDGQAV